MKDATDITIILDRSGSMQSIRNDTIGGFNRLLEDQKKDPSPATLSVVQFDHEYEPICGCIDLHYAVPLTEATFVPRGQTALRDAIGRTIVQTGERLARMPEHERPSKVLIVVLTDGLENASQEYSAARIRDMVTLQREKYSWEFVVIGANQDTVLTGKELGISQVANFTADAQGTSDAFIGMSHGLSNYRSVGKYTP